MDNNNYLLADADTDTGCVDADTDIPGISATQWADQRHSSAFAIAELEADLGLILVGTEFGMISLSSAFCTTSVWCVCVCVGGVLGWVCVFCVLSASERHITDAFFSTLCLCVKWVAGPKIKMKSFTFGQRRMDFINFLTYRMCAKNDNKNNSHNNQKTLCGGKDWISAIVINKFGDLNKIKQTTLGLNIISQQLLELSKKMRCDATVSLKINMLLALKLRNK